MSEHLQIGFDAGMGALKLYGPPGGAQMLSQVAAVTGARVAPMLGLARTRQQPPLLIQADGTRLYVGAGAHDWGRPIENLDYDRLTGAPEMTALFYGALTRYLQAHALSAQGARMQMVVGLPLETLTGAEEEVKRNSDSVKWWMKGLHRWKADDGEYSIEIDEVKVTSQPIGALFDYLLDDAGQFVPERKSVFGKEAGIISVGFNTIELLAVRDRAAVNRFTAGAKLGVRRLLEIVNRERLYSLGELDGLLRAHALDLESALPIWTREVTGAIESQWGNVWRRFAVVLIVGGGAILLKDSLPYRFNGKAVVPDDPVLSIARGLYKLALQQTRKRGASE